MKNFLLVLLLCLLSLRGQCSPQRERYEFHGQAVSQNNDYHTVWLWDNRTKRVLWKREMDAFTGATWSKDHRALAVEGGIEHRWRVLVWREGFRLRDFAPLDDYSMGCLWSPDNRHLLVRYGGSGAADVDVGLLYCLELKRWPRYRYFKLGFAHKMAWKDSRTAIYWDLDFDANRPPKLTAPRIWRVPLHSRIHRSRRRGRGLRKVGPRQSHRNNPVRLRRCPNLRRH